MIVTVLKTPFEKLKARVLYKSFENKLFPEKLLYELSNATLVENANGFEEFIEELLFIKKL